jgi:site-specific DNA recombinase
MTLIRAVARARVWYDRLLGEKTTTLRTLACEYRVTDGYVGRILQCAFLAPDLVEAILHGRQPAALTLERLLDDLPISWVAQRETVSSV